MKTSDAVLIAESLKGKFAEGTYSRRARVAHHHFIKRLAK